MTPLSFQLLIVIFLFFHLQAWSFQNPWIEGNFEGRIAYSADGNYNDEDDWAASAVALSIINEFELHDKLVHFDYNCILPKTDQKWELEHKQSITGAIQHFEFDESVFYDCQKDLQGAVDNIVRAINQSSAENPLYFILAGPMEVPYLGISRADPEKRKYVYCISHNVWNDGYASRDLVQHNKRHVIPMGITWIQIKDQNGHLSTGPFGRASTLDEWQPWQWLNEPNDEKLSFLWNRLRATTRADCSDAGMTYFLLTGDEDVTIEDLEKLLKRHELPTSKNSRRRIRIEAENFSELNSFEIKYVNDRKASQRISVTSSELSAMKSHFREPYVGGPSVKDITVRYFETDIAGQLFSLKINSALQASFKSVGDSSGWSDFFAPAIPISPNDMIEINVTGSGPFQIDYIELNSSDTADDTHALLDDPAALPGQIMVGGANPGYLKYNGGGPAYLCGPDNPEDFLYRGTLNEDGTRSGGGQEEMIAKMAAAKVNAFHCQMFRMQRCNIKNEGDDEHCPFIGHDPSKGINRLVLDQWDHWISLMEENNIILHLEFYNDATDVEQMGWTLQPNGDLHPEEISFFREIVEKFKYHKNIMWGLEESCNKLPRSRTLHFKKLAALIAKIDNHNHPIIQSFVIPEDPEGDFPGGGGTSDDYIDDPNIKVVTWLHLNPHKDDFEAQHQEYLKYYHRDSKYFVVMKNETYHHPRKGKHSRIYMWSCAMAGLHSLEAYHHAHDGADSTLAQDGFINQFLEATDYHRLLPRDDLASGSTNWVLARPGHSYITYTYNYTEPMGLEGMVPGTYDLRWLDAHSGQTDLQKNIMVTWGENLWQKPASFGNEIVVYLVKR